MTTWNPSDADSHFVFSGGNLIANGSSGLAFWKSCRATTSQSSGKFYFEVKINTVGSSQTGFGLGLASAALTSYIGAGSANGFSAFSGGNFFINGAGTSLWGGAGFGSSNTVACAVDLTNGLVWFRNIGSSGWNQSSTSGSNNPATGVGGRSFTISGALFPSLSFGTASDQATANFGLSGFAGTVPGGFSNWDPQPYDPTKFLFMP